MGKDADAYRDFIALYKDTQPRGHDAMELDDSVAAKIEANVARETDRMTNDLKGSKNNLIKESIRVRELVTEYIFLAKSSAAR